MSSDKQLILLGTHDVYIHTLEFDPATGTLTPINRLQVSQDPSWLTRHPSIPDIIYSNGHVEGKVSCLRVSPNGAMEVLDEAVSGAGGPTHLAVLGDHSALLIAHYGKETGCLSSLPLDPSTGRFMTDHTVPTQGFQPRYTPSSHPRLNAPHVHQGLVHHDEVITCDLGNNRVWRLRLGGEEDDTRWVVKGVIDEFEDADGPRHAVIHPSGNIIYVLNEVSSILSVHTLSPDGSSKRVSRHPLLPQQDLDNPKMLGAGILLLPPLSPSVDSLLICSNRFSISPQGDSLALFTVSSDGSTVTPAPKPHYWGIGKHIRALGSDPTGRYIITAGRDHGGVVILERVGDGTELKEVVRADVPNVVVPIWL